MRKLANIRQIKFNDGTYVVFEDYRNQGGLYLFTDVYYKGLSDSAYLGQYSEFDNPNTYVRKSGKYIILYEYEVGGIVGQFIKNKITKTDNKIVKHIINFYDTEEDMDIVDTFGNLIDLFNQNVDDKLILKEGIENKKMLVWNRRSYYLMRDKETYEQLIETSINREEYHNPIKGIVDKLGLQKIKVKRRDEE